MAIYNEDIFSLFNEYNSSQNGIKSNSVVDRQNRYGINVLDKQKKDSFIKKFLLQFKNIMIIILFLSAIISSVLAIINKDSESLFEGLFIFLVVIFNAIVGVVQEQKAENALEMLKKSTEPFATIIRDNKQQKINIADLVVGDIILLKAGNFVPADIRLIESKNLKCNESSITGESIAVSKNSDTLKQKKLNISEQSNMCFSGTTITEGSGKGIIVAVGKNTELGKISKILNTSIKEKTPLEKEIDKIGKTLTFGILMIVFVVFIVQIFFNKSSSILDSLLTAISLAVAAIPESLPAVITLIMAMGVQKLAKKNAIIKKLSSVETLGCCNIICSDKTGTLTKNEMSISHIYLNNKLSHYKDFDIKENLKFCQIASTCNNITINDNKIIGDATETSIIKFLKSNNINISILKNQFPAISENEFSSTKKQMRLLCKNQNTQISHTTIEHLTIMVPQKFLEIKAL